MNRFCHTLALLFSPLCVWAEPAEPSSGSRAELAEIKAAGEVAIPEPFTPQELGLRTPRASALRLVATTLELNPQVALQKTVVEERSGALTREEGRFDTHVLGRLAPGGEVGTRRTHPRDPNAPAYPNPLRYRRGVVAYEAGVQRLLANGVLLSPKVGFSQRAARDFGGRYEDDLRGNVAFDVMIPLGKGAGRASNLAPQEAARYDLLASTLQLRHVTAQNVATALRAYWAVRAAQAVYELRWENEGIAQRLLGVGTALAEGDEIPPAQLAQTLADRRNTQALRIRSGVALIAARQNLAVAVGLPSSSLLMAPLAADEFPSPPQKMAFPTAAELIGVALRLRDDLRAAQELVRSRKVLLEAARLDLRPTINLHLGGGFTPFDTQEDGGSTRGRGWQAGAELSIDWPLENRTAKGEVAMWQARYAGSVVAEEELHRVITSQVVTALAELKGAARNVHLFNEAVEWYARALKAQEELFALGQGSVSETITARQRLVEAQLNHVMAQQNYANALVTLRFACGLLILSDEAGSWVAPECWRRIPLAGGPKEPQPPKRKR